MDAVATVGGGSLSLSLIQDAAAGGRDRRMAAGGLGLGRRWGAQASRVGFFLFFNTILFQPVLKNPFSTGLTTDT